MSRIRVNDKEYFTHPKYDLFCADKDGNIISIVTLKLPRVHLKSGDLLVKGRETKRLTRCTVIVFVWEVFNGIVPNNYVVKRKAGEGNNLDNLQLEEKTRKKLSPEERKQRDRACAVRWRNTVWDCPDCGFRTTNNASGHHKRACKFSNNPYTEEEKRIRHNKNMRWNMRRWTCDLCDKEYSNSYRIIHRQYCKQRKME